MDPSSPQRLTKARVALLLDEPFFGSLMMQLKPIAHQETQRFSTNGKELRYNPQWMATLDDGQLRTVLAHEVMHAALLHPYRVGKRDLKLANVAADYAVNNYLNDFNVAAIGRGESPPFPWPQHEGKDDVLLNSRYSDMSFEEIYEQLANQPPGGSGGSDGSGSGPGNSQQDPHADYEGPGDFTEGPQDAAEAQAQEATWKVALKQAATIAKGQGRLPGSMERLISEALDPRLSWREILRTLLTSACNDDYDWSRRNVRYGASPFVMPSLHSPRLGRIVVAIDTSGSVDERQLNEFMSEVRAIMFDCRPEKLVIVQCDDEIQEWREADPFDDINVALKGGGGTSFCPVFERIAAETEPPAALVYLTDLCGSSPKEAPNYPVIWACNNARTGPFGDTVHISK